MLYDLTERCGAPKENQYTATLRGNEEEEGGEETEEEEEEGEEKEMASAKAPAFVR